MVTLRFITRSWLTLVGTFRANQIFSIYLFAYPQSPDENLCRGTVISQAVFTQVGMFLMETVIILRGMYFNILKPIEYNSNVNLVYALYNRSPKMKWFLFGIFITSAALELCGSGIFIHVVANPSGCSMLGEKNSSIFFFWCVDLCYTTIYQTLAAQKKTSAGAGLAQIVLVVAMVIGLVLRHLSGKSRTPLASMLLNQGLATFVLVLGIVLFTLL